MNTGTLDLPKTIGVWNRPDSPRLISSKNIFKYMNGAGELYLGYRFRHLEVFDYMSADQGNILVELYFSIKVCFKLHHLEGKHSID